MKRFKSLVFLTIAALLLLGGVAMAESVDSLPDDIRAYFVQRSMGDITVLDTTNGYELGGSDACYFVLTRNAKKVNTLYAFKWEGAGWKYSYATNSAIPQTNHTISIGIVYSGEEWPTGEHFETPQLYISQIDAGNEYPELTLTFQLTKGKWLLHRVYGYTDNDSMLIRDGAISYYKNIESPEITGTARGVIQRDLRYFSLSALPKTLKEAKNKLTNAPALPKGSLTAQEIAFTGGKAFDVYAAPEKSALRGGNGKAKVSTNGWIQVFGREDDWILIQYSIDSKHYRFGYISASSLPKKAVVPALAFEKTIAVTAYDVTVTDDPLYSRAALVSLQEGSAVTVLCVMGNDAYIEGVSGGKLFRGFVPSDALQTEEKAFAVFTDENAQQYPLFVMTKMHVDDKHRVQAVTGHFERFSVEEDGCETTEAAKGSERTYALSKDFHASMMDSLTEPSMDYIPVTDLYNWYIDAYIGRDVYEGNELVYACDLTAEELETNPGDFWFVTTRVMLNEQEEISYMEYVFVPWA